MLIILLSYLYSRSEMTLVYKELKVFFGYNKTYMTYLLLYDIGGYYGN